MKKFPKMTTLIAAALATVTLAGCTGGCSSCGGAKVTNNALTNSNWYTQTGYKGIQPYFIEGNEHFAKETVIYDVTSETKNNGFYKAEYDNGAFKTEFYAREYDWNSESVPEKYREEKKDIVYSYETEYTISVKYIKGESETQWFEDSIKTVSLFRAAYYGLQPVYSKQEMKITSPAMHNPATLEAAYKRYEVTYENHYNYACSEVTSVKTENGATETKLYGKLDKTSNTLFDNSSLYAAIRSMKLADNLAQTVNLFNAQSGGISTIKLAGNGTAIQKEELAKISAALADKQLYTPVTKDEEGNDIEDKGIQTVAISISYDGGEMSGAPQTVWYAALKDADNNTARCTMLKLSIPLPFGLGTLNYSLKEVESTIWNGK